MFQNFLIHGFSSIITHKGLCHLLFLPQQRPCWTDVKIRYFPRQICASNIVFVVINQGQGIFLTHSALRTYHLCISPASRQPDQWTLCNEQWEIHLQKKIFVHRKSLETLASNLVKPTFGSEQSSITLLGCFEQPLPPPKLVPHMTYITLNLL